MSGPAAGRVQHEADLQEPGALQHEAERPAQGRQHAVPVDALQRAGGRCRQDHVQQESLR